MRSNKMILGALLGYGLSSCSLGSAAFAQPIERCSPSEIGREIPEFQPLWRSVQQQVWSLQDDLAEGQDNATLHQQGTNAIVAMEKLSTLKAAPFKCKQLKTFLTRMETARIAIQLALERDDIATIKVITTSVAQDFPFADGAGTTAYINSAYRYRAPYWGYSSGGYGHHGLQSHHHHHH